MQLYLYHYVGSQMLSVRWCQNSAVFTHVSLKRFLSNHRLYICSVVLEYGPTSDPWFVPSCNLNLIYWQALFSVFVSRPCRNTFFISEQNHTSPTVCTVLFILPPFGVSYRSPLLKNFVFLWAKMIFFLYWIFFCIFVVWNNWAIQLPCINTQDIIWQRIRQNRG